MWITSYHVKIFEAIINHLQIGNKIALHLRGEVGFKVGIAECRADHTREEASWRLHLFFFTNPF